MVCRYFTEDSSSVRTTAGEPCLYLVKSSPWDRVPRESTFKYNLGSLRQIRPANVRDRNFICAGITAASKAGQAAQSRQPCVTGRIAHAAETGDTALCV